MTIGGVVLPDQYTPLQCTKPRAARSIAVAATYGGVAVFDWGAFLPGKEITLTWKSMTVALFELLDAVYQAGANVLWISGIDNLSYTVKISAFDGALLFDANNEYMLGITMTMVIVSEVS
jgi:hypothetical protein